MTDPIETLWHYVEDYAGAMYEWAFVLARDQVAHKAGLIDAYSEETHRKARAVDQARDRVRIRLGLPPILP